MQSSPNSLSWLLDSEDKLPNVAATRGPAPCGLAAVGQSGQVCQAGCRGSTAAAVQRAAAPPVQLPAHDCGPPAAAIDATTDPAWTARLLVLLSATLVFAAAWQIGRPRPSYVPRQNAVVAPVEAVRSPDEGLKKLPQEKLLAMLDATPGHQRAAALATELARRGAWPELIALRGHGDVAVRAAVPRALVTRGAEALPFVPLLAEDLASPDPEVRTRSAAALRALVRRFGPYREPSELALEPESVRHRSGR